MDRPDEIVLQERQLIATHTVNGEFVPPKIVLNVVGGREETVGDDQKDE